MRIFLVWLSITGAAFAAYGFAYHTRLTQAPRQILIAVDDSHAMKSAWPLIPELLDSLDDSPYARFALVTTKARVHSWSNRLELGSIRPYAPRNFERLTGAHRPNEVTEADRRILITNATPSATPSLPGWEIVRLSRGGL